MTRALAAGLLAGMLSIGSPAASADPAWRGVLRSVTDVALVTRADSDRTAALYGFTPLAGPARCDVRVQSLVHATVGPRDEVTTASAALLVPQGAGCAGPHPLLAYARGTSRDRARTLANPEDLETNLLVNMFAAQGFIVVATDYLGYAGSDFPYHPYLHAQSEATTMVDSIRAARASLASAAVPTDGRIFITGYSQGGHAALAAQREVEANPTVEFRLAGVGGMSGPYDIPLTIKNGIELAFSAPLGGYSGASVVQQVQLVIGDVLSQTVAILIQRIPRLRAQFGRESVIDWRPVAPMMLCGGARDRTVSWENTARAAGNFFERGFAASVLDVDVAPQYAPSVPPAGTPAEALSSYHNRVVPPLCFHAVREWIGTLAR